MRKVILLFLFLVCLVILMLGFVFNSIPNDAATYNVWVNVDDFESGVFIISALLFLFFMSQAISRGFNTIRTNMGLIIGFILMLYTTYTVHLIETEYFEMLKVYSNDGLQVAESTLTFLSRVILTTRLIFIVLITGFILVCIKTGMIIFNKKSNKL